MSAEFEQHRGTSQFVKDGERVTKRPGSHTIRERLLRLAEPRRDARGRIFKPDNPVKKSEGQKPATKAYKAIAEGVETDFQLRFDPKL